MNTNYRSIPTLALGSLLAVSLLCGCATDRAVISQADEVHTGLEPAVITDPELTAYLQSVGDRIIASARELDAQQYGPKTHRSEDSSWMFSQNMRFHFVNSQTLNAFTTGGEHMYIYTELFEQCHDEDELAAVMAHEYGHVYGRHVQKGMDRQTGTILAAAGVGVAGAAIGGKEHGAEYGATFGGAALAAGQFIGMGYTREDEAEADQLGFTFYTHAGWDPDQFSGFFKTMIEKGYDTTPALASDHPTLASRVAIADKRAGELPPEATTWRKPPIANEAKFKQLQGRAVQVAKTMPNDKSLEGAQQLLAAFSSCFSPVDQPGQAAARQNVSEHTSPGHGTR